MVPAKQEEVLRVLHLVRQEQADHLQTLLAAIDIIAEEEVIRLGREPAVLKQTKQVAVLAVHVAANLERRLELQQTRLRQENLSASEGDAAMRGGRSVLVRLR